MPIDAAAFATRAAAIIAAAFAAIILRRCRRALRHALRLPRRRCRR